MVLSDIDLYGFCPERDTFYGVVCEICNAIVKPQALIQHMGKYMDKLQPWLEDCHCLLKATMIVGLLCYWTHYLDCAVDKNIPVCSYANLNKI